MEKRKIAFWRHDEVPYVLSGEVTSVNAVGDITVEGDYEVGETIRIMPYEEGLQLAEKLKEIEMITKERENFVRDECAKAVSELMELKDLADANRVFSGSEIKEWYFNTTGVESLVVETKTEYENKKLSEIDEEKRYKLAPVHGYIAIKEV